MQHIETIKRNLFTKTTKEKNAENLLLFRGDRRPLERYRENVEVHKHYGERHEER